MAEGITPINWGAIGDYFGRRYFATLRGIINLSHSWALVLLPWLLPWVPHVRDGKTRNELHLIDRWKIIDNLRRSLLRPVLMLILVAGWLWLPGSPAVWTLLAALTLASDLFIALIDRLVHSVMDAVRFDANQTIQKPLLRWLLELVALPYQAMIACGVTSASGGIGAARRSATAVKRGAGPGERCVAAGRARSTNRRAAADDSRTTPLATSAPATPAPAVYAIPTTWAASPSTMTSPRCPGMRKCRRPARGCSSRTRSAGAAG